jgi:hypothetical protein
MKSLRIAAKASNFAQLRESTPAAKAAKKI